EWATDVAFYFRQGWVIAIGGAAGSVGEALHPSIPCRYQHIEKTSDIRFVGSDGVIDGARNRAKRGLMKHVIRPSTGIRTIALITNIPLGEGKALPLCWSNQPLHFIKIPLMARGEII